MLFRRPKFKTFPGGSPQTPYLTRACGTRLTSSAIVYYSLYPGERARREWALWQFCPTTEELHLILVKQCRQLKRCEKQFFKILTIYKAILPSFVQKIIKSRCYVDLSPQQTSTEKPPKNGGVRKASELCKYKASASVCRFSVYVNDNGKRSSGKRSRSMHGSNMFVWRI